MKSKFVTALIFILITASVVYLQTQNSRIVNLPLSVTQSGTWNIGSITTLPSIAITNTAFTANAGTNLNTSLLALESGGNLASLVAKDFATQTTLALIKAKTDNLDVLLSTRTKPADSQHVIIDSGSISNTTFGVTGTFWQATQPISAASLPLPSGAATETTLAAQTKAEDSAHNSGDQGEPILVVRTDTNTTKTNADGDYINLAADNYGVLKVSMDHPNKFTAGFNSIGNTLTQIQAAPSAGLSIYITSIAIQTTTATSGTYAFQSGTGSNCGTSTTAVFPISGTSNRFNAPINTSAMANIIFNVPIKLTSAHAFCVIGVATNTVSGQVVGYIAP